MVVLPIAFFEKLHVDELWISSNIGKNFCYTAGPDLASSLGVQKSAALPMFYAITGCDTVCALLVETKFLLRILG